ncbi:MAG: hypothetical protein IJE89_06435 [Bacilli bacterium]|nr:hypothetical protein [Bacilli bacterium]MBQ2981841.1 hypothetical protein [Lachnospiraceae bacterium]
MIKVDELREFRPQVRYQNGEGITLAVVCEAIKECAHKYGIPVEFRYDEVKSGGLFTSSIEECMVMYHPLHQNDYYKFCIRVSHQGMYAFVSINDFGKSVQMNKAYREEMYRADRAGKEMSYKIGSVFGQMVSTIGKSKAKLEEEERYYQCVSDIFDEIVS